MVSFMGLVLYGVGAMLVAAMGLLVAFQEKLIYVPVLPGLARSYALTPSRLRLDYEDVWLRSADGVRLHAWFIKLFPCCKGPTILFFQENAGNIAHRLEFIRIMLQRLHCNVFMLSYRGYGESDGHPSQHGITMDAQAALDHLAQRKDIDTSRIVVFGRSLGGAVGSVLAKNNPDKVSALILENTFASILDMAGVLLPFLRWFIGGTVSKGPRILNFLVRSPWNTIEIIGQMDSQFIQKHLTGIEPLTGSNYGNWKMQVEIVLGCLDYDFVLTKDKPDELDDSSSLFEKKLHAKWVKANSLAMLIMKAFVNQTISGGILVCETAMDLLETIKNQFEGFDKARQYSNLVKLINLKYDVNGDVREHILKVFQLIIRLRELGLQLRMI